MHRYNEEEEDDAAADDDVRLRTWKRLIVDVPVLPVLPKDASFGGGIIAERRDAERLAFYGDKILNLSVVGLYKFANPSVDP